MTDWLESEEAIGKVDDLLASVGLHHGRRETLAGTWKDGERTRRAPAAPSAVAPRTSRARQPEPLLVPGWDRLPWLRHGFSTRAGGVSTVYGPPASLNLGWTQHDDPAHVAENRARFRNALAPAADLVALRQIHSGLIRILHRAPDGTLRDEATHLPALTPDHRPALRGDALMTDTPGLLLAVSTADCVPVLLADTRRRAIAAFHAGWRGTLARIVERGVGRMRLRFGSRPQDLVAAIGPSIGPCCYAVGEDLRFDFESQFAYAPQLFSEVYDSDPVRDKYPLLFLTARAPGHSPIGPQIHLDLWEANRRQLLDAGLLPDRIWSARECTACTRLRTAPKYFSHRAEHGFTGRALAAVAIL